MATFFCPALFSFPWGTRLWQGADNACGVFARPAFDVCLSFVAFLSHKVTISTDKVFGSKRAKVLLPETHPPVSPGLMSRFFFSRLISGW
jgi:hypothetical protein